MEPDVTPEAAIYQFLSGFDIPAYPTSSVPDQAAFPYLTYDLVIGEWGQGEVNMTVDVWYRGESEAAPNAKVREIGRALQHGGTQLRCDGGTLWLKKGFPWAQAVSVAGEDEMVKRRHLNVSIETLTF